MQKKIIFCLVGIVIVLGVVFLSQQAYSRVMGKTLISDATSQAKAVLAQGTDWAMANVLPKISGEVQARGDAIKNDVGQEQKKVSENIGEKISNYVSGIANSIVHPGNPQNCPATQPTQTSAKP